MSDIVNVNASKALELWNELDDQAASAYDLLSHIDQNRWRMMDTLRLTVIGQEARLVEANAEIKRLRAHDGAERELWASEVATLRTQRDEWAERCAEVRRLRDAGREEIERLRIQIAEFEAEIADWEAWRRRAFADADELRKRDSGNATLCDQVAMLTATVRDLEAEVDGLRWSSKRATDRAVRALHDKRDLEAELAQIRGVMGDEEDPAAAVMRARELTPTEIAQFREPSPMPVPDSGWIGHPGKP